ncbi:MAG: phenylalanine--tRNA ligase beta subunit-related protein [Anaerolineae bacterium]|nr:phenylalanine--tRNA ligase beta subunit-related protein [Anaerolineae bacterium]
MRGFRYDTAVLAQFPAIRGGVILARGLQNGPTPPDLRDAFNAEQRATLARLGDTPLADVPSLAAWRRAFSAFGVKPTQYRSAPEALLRRLTKKGDIPNINKLVDLANLVSIRYALPVAVFDTRATTGMVTVRFAAGDERFTDLGADEVTPPEPGEVIFVDEAGLVSARRWCWRQSDQSAAREATTDAIVTVEGLHETATGDVPAALADLVALLERHGRGALQWALLSPENPALIEDVA